MFKIWLLALSLLCTFTASSESWDHLFDNPKYEDVKISPNGDMLAVKGLVEKKLALYFLDLSKNKVINVVKLSGNQQVGSTTG